MTLVLELAGAAVAGFVFGVLFGRKNTVKVEADLAALKAEVSKLSGGKLNV